MILLPGSTGNSASLSTEIFNSSKAIVDVKRRYVDWQENWMGGVQWSILMTGHDIGYINGSGDLV